MARLNAANQKVAEQKAEYILKYSKNAQDANQAAYQQGMASLNQRDRTAQRIADEVERIVRARAYTFYSAEGK